MSSRQPSSVYREQLSSLYHGLALWNPKPVEGLYENVSIGDVGYLLENGAFMRLFNVTLPWDDPSNRLLEVAEEYKPLELGHFINIHSSEMHQREHCSHVSKVDNNRANTHDDGRGQMYECQAQSRGALLSLPHGGHSEDVIRTKVFKDYIRDNVGSWFRWSEENGFPVERMEDLILVTGCTLTTSWAAAVFNIGRMSADSNAPTISLETEKFDRGDARFFWRNDRGNVDYHNSHFDPTVEGIPHPDQCVFIRGFRARRILFRTRSMRAAAEPIPDDLDDHRDDEIQVTRIPDGSKYRDPLFAILDYIEEKCREHNMDENTEDIMAIAHEDDLQLFEGMETLDANAIEKFLHEEKMPLVIENGTAILRDPADNTPTISDAKTATFYAAAEMNGESVSLDIHPALTRYLLKPDDLDTDHGYNLLNEEMTSSAVYPHVQSLKLEYFQGYPEVINIMASSNPRVGITVQDVLRNIQKNLGMPIRNSEIISLSPEERAEINHAFKERCKTDEERRKGLCRIDFLCGKDRLRILPEFPADGALGGAGVGRGSFSRGGSPDGDVPLIYNAGQRPQPDLSLVSPNEVTVRMHNPGPERPSRLGYGTKGRAVALRANFFALGDYSLKKYSISLRHADDLPLVDAGGSGRSNYIPAELCDVEPGEAHLGKLGPKETSDMLKVASRRPAENTPIVMNTGLPRLGYKPFASVHRSFNICLANQMAVIHGRELPLPSVTYGKGVPRVQNGSWNILDVKFHQGAKMTNWKVLVVCDGVESLSFSGPRDEKLINFIKAFANKCRNSGVDVGNEPPAILPTDQLLPIKADPGRRKALENISKTIERFGESTSISFILCLLQKRDDFIYPGIKRLCSVTHGIRTQCLLLEKALNPGKQDQYLSNVALKVNTKLGGINHSLGGDALGWLTREQTILVGIDVTHPGPSSIPGTPSIAGVVASVDKDFVQFPASLRLQKSKQEEIAELSDMIIERLLAYRRRSPTNALPKRMIVFRDGVSESQYDMVIRKELPQIITAFKRIDAKNPGYRPTLSIVICGKRHNARFYPTDSEFADKNGNTRPGTVVDKGVTSMLDFDFYLQAHAGLQGTVKPTHYIVIYDESSLTADMVQQGVHTASYLYARATKAVSLVPPAYYADIVCEQARYWIHEFLNLGPGSDTASSTDGSGGGVSAASSAMRKEREASEQRVFDAAQRLWGKGLHPNLQDCMFYI